MDYQDILYDVKDGAARITINRPEKYNAFRGQTCEELVHALNKAGWDDAIGVIVLAGAGDKAFCTGGDQSVGDEGSHYDGRGTIGLPMEDLHSILRDVPKPVIARVQGYAIGGGNVLCTICDFTIASESAVFGQVGPKMGSVDPGFGTAYLARVVGEKKAREMWYMCRRYPAKEALAMGLVNAVVPDDELDAEVDRWCAEIMEKAPRRWRLPNVRSTWTAKAFVASPAWGCMPSKCITIPMNQKKAASPLLKRENRISVNT